MKMLTSHVLIHVSAWTAPTAPRRVCPQPLDRILRRMPL